MGTLGDSMMSRHPTEFITRVGQVENPPSILVQQDLQTSVRKVRVCRRFVVSILFADNVVAAAKANGLRLIVAL